MDTEQAASILPLLFIAATGIFQFIIRPKLHRRFNTRTIADTADRIITANLIILLMITAIDPPPIYFVLPLHAISGYMTGTIYRHSYKELTGNTGHKD